MAISLPPKPPPLSVSRFELSGKVGEGPLGSIFRGRDTELDKLVAVHIIDPELLAEPGVIDYLRSEYRAAAGIEHPNVLRLFDFGKENDCWYLVTEWVDGISLAQMITAHARLPEETAVRILTQVGQAVDYINLAGYHLCAVGCSSVLIRNDGIVKLVAFEPAVRAERAKRRAGRTDVEQAGNIQSAKRPTFSDTMRSLGATLYEAVTGIVWVDPGPATTTGARRSRSRSSRPRQRAAGLSERVEAAVRWATHYDADRQPVSCAEWLKLLRSKSRAPATPKIDTRPVEEAGDDRRASIRYAVGVGSSCTINPYLFGESSNDKPDLAAVWPLVVRDVSSGGIGILLARRCEPGTELAIELISEANEARSLPVRVVRVRRDTLGHWVHGCEFFQPLEQHELLAVLGHLGRVDPS
jgi:eukaryotic-like serine/threonine-protein kinase